MHNVMQIQATGFSNAHIKHQIRWENVILLTVIMVIGARRSAFSILETAIRLGFSHSRVYENGAENQKHPESWNSVF